MSVVHVTPTEAKKRLDENRGYIYLDVRSVAEFEAGHAPGSINIPIAEPNPATGQMEPNADFLSVVEATFPRDTRLIVGCRSGGRSARACAVLLKAGYQNPMNMAGGFAGGPDPGGAGDIEGWSVLGFPVEKGDGGEGSYRSTAEKARK